jgi:hypothetical protein
MVPTGTGFAGISCHCRALRSALDRSFASMARRLASEAGMETQRDNVPWLSATMETRVRGCGSLEHIRRTHCAWNCKGASFQSTDSALPETGANRRAGRQSRRSPRASTSNSSLRDRVAASRSSWPPQNSGSFATGI